MKKLIFSTFLTLSMAGFLSCKSSKSSTTAPAGIPQQTLAWDGVYTGVLPCTDCAGEQTTLTLGKDLMYKVTTKYNGKGETEHKYVGRINWNAEGTMITLSPPFEGGQPHSFLVEQNKLTLIDMNARTVKKGSTKSFVLAKS